MYHSRQRKTNLSCVDESDSRSINSPKGVDMADAAVEDCTASRLAVRTAFGENGICFGEERKLRDDGRIAILTSFKAE